MTCIPLYEQICRNDAAIRGNSMMIRRWLGDNPCFLLLTADLFGVLRKYAVYCLSVAPLAQRLEQRPFKSWVVGSNPTGGTSKPLETLASKGFSIPAILTQTQLDKLTLFAPQTRIVTSSSAPVNTLPYYRRTRLPARQNLHPLEESSHWQTPQRPKPPVSGTIFP